MTISNITPLPISSLENSVSGGPLPYEVLGDKFEYWEDDNVGLFYAYVPAAIYASQSAFIKVKGHDLITLDSLSVPYSESTNRFSFEVDFNSLANDDYIVSVRLLNYDWEPTTGLALGGSAIVKKYLKYPPSGGLTLGGSATLTVIEAVTHNFVASGSLILGSTAITTYSKKYLFVASGVLLIKGRAGYRILDQPATPETPIVLELLNPDGLYYIQGGYVPAITHVDIPPEYVPSNIVMLMVEPVPPESNIAYIDGGWVASPDTTNDLIIANNEQTQSQLPLPS